MYKVGTLVIGRYSNVLYIIDNKVECGLLSINININDVHNFNVFDCTEIFVCE